MSLRSTYYVSRRCSSRVNCRITRIKYSKITNIFNVSKFPVFKILEEQRLHHLYNQLVHALLPRDFLLFLFFCQWILHLIPQIPNFSSGVLFTDEVHFELHCIRHFHNNHLWADKNSHGIFEANFLQLFSVNICLGILYDYLIGLYFLVSLF